VAAVALGVLAGLLFGLLAVTVRLALRRGADPEVGAVVILGVGALVAWVAALPTVGGVGDWSALWIFFAIGALVPGASQILFILAVRDAGPSRAAILIGVAPLLSVALALVLLDEPFRPLLLVATVLVVTGGAALAGERSRPAAFRRIGAVFAVSCAGLFAIRDNAVRWAAEDVEAPAVVAAAVSLLGALAVVATYLALARRDRTRRGIRLAARAFWPAGVTLGFAYVCLIVAFDRGRVSVVAPLNATQSLFAIGFAAAFVGAVEAIGRRTILAGVLIVAGAVIVGIIR
jgi:drug/metabolite transporter (DMT)-like permease